MAIQPLGRPDLSQLSDPTKDLFGNMGDPSSMMSFMSNKQVDDLLAPKPLFDVNIKPSAEAAKALQTAQQQQEAVMQEQAQAQATLARQQQAVMEQAQQQAEQATKANMAMSQKIYEEQQKALEQKKKEQGGVLGAAPDGSFVMDKAITKWLQEKATDWNAIKSDKERKDVAENVLADYAAQLKSSGASDDAIAKEIAVGRKIFDANIQAYTKTMKEDKRGLLDLTVAPLAKYGSFLMQAGGLGAKAVGLDTVGNSLLDQARESNAAIDDFESSSIKLDRANSDYESRKFDKENPNANWRDGGIIGVASGAGAGLKRMWNNDLLLNNVADFIPQLVGSMGFGAMGKAAIAPTLANIAAKEAAGETVGLGARLATGTLATKYGIVNLGSRALAADRLAMGAYGTAMGVADAGSGAYDAVMDTSFDDIKKHYGENSWNAVVQAHGGSQEEARKALADDAMFTAAKGNAPVAALTSLFGLESAISGLLTRKAVVEAAKGATLKSLAKGTAETLGEAGLEGLEEGYTQYQSNVGAKPYTGVDEMKGTSEAAGLGAFLGGASAGVMNAMSHASNNTPKFDSDIGSVVQDFVSTGNVNYDALRPVIDNHFNHIEKLYDGKEGTTGLEDLQQIKQDYYNNYLDNTYTVKNNDGVEQSARITDLLTPEQNQVYKDWLKLTYGVNTNNYAPNLDTKDYKAFKSGNLTEVKQIGNDDILNAFRLKNGVELDQIPAERLPYTQALLRTIDHMTTIDNNVNSREREAQFVDFRNTDLKNDDNLSLEDVLGITQFARNVLGANSRRLTDSQQARYNEQVTANATSQNSSDPTEQTTSNANAGPVTNQSRTTSTTGTVANQLQATAEELAGIDLSATGGNNAQGVGNNGVQQTTAIGDSTNIAPTGSSSTDQNNAGLRQTSFTGNTAITTTPTNASEQIASNGVISQASQTNQPIRQPVATTTQTTTGSGKLGTSAAKRNSNGGSNQAVTERLIETGIADVTASEMELAFNKTANTVKQSSLRIKSLSTLAGTENLKGKDLAITNAIYLVGLSNTQLNQLILDEKFGKKFGNGSQSATIKKVRRALITALAKNNEVVARTGIVTQPVQQTVPAEQSTQAPIIQSQAQPIQTQPTVQQDPTLDEMSRQLDDIIFNNEIDDFAKQNNVEFVEPLSTTFNETEFENDLKKFQENVIPAEVFFNPTIPMSYIQDNANTTLMPYLGTAIVDNTTVAKNIIYLSQLTQMAVSDIINYVEQMNNEVSTDGNIIDFVLNKNTGIWELAPVQQGITYAQPQPTETNSTNTSSTDTNQPTTATKTQANIKRLEKNNTSVITNDETSNFASDAPIYTLDEILKGVTNKRGEQSPSLNDLAPDNDSADRPTIELTIKGKSYIGKLFRYRQGNKRFIAFVHEGKSYGLKNENQDWVSLGSGIGSKGIESINNQTNIQIKVISTPITQQENANVVPSTQFSRTDNQPTLDRTQNENGGNAVGNRTTNNEQPRKSLSSDGRGLEQGSQTISEQRATTRPVGETSETNRPTTSQTNEVNDVSLKTTYHADNLTNAQRSAIQEIADSEGVGIDVVYQAIVDDNGKFFTGRDGTSAIKGLSDWEVPNPSDVVARLTTALKEPTKAVSAKSELDTYFENNPDDYALINAYVTEEFNKAQQAYEIAVNEEKLNDEIVNNYNTFKSVNSFVEQFLADNSFENAIAQAKLSSMDIRTNGFAFNSLPTSIQNVIKKVWDKFKSSVVTISMALAVSLGVSVTIPNNADAATPTEKAVVQHIVNTNDNQGKQMIVADKKAGTLTMYDSGGNVLSSTPALFGKSVGDTVANNNTPSGRYELKSANISTEGYGGSAQVLTQDGKIANLNDSAYAIHRVYTQYKSENRQGRLDSKTAEDNRISHGCINVPIDFYNSYLDNKQDTVVYVLPETTAGQTGIFSAMKTATTTENKPTPVAQEVNDVNVKSVEVSASDIKNATPIADVKSVPVIAQQPISIKGTTLSGQIANITPTAFKGITADQLHLPELTYTPAELHANGTFDTQPVAKSVTTEDGLNLFQIAVSLAGIGGVGYMGYRTAKSKKKKKLGNKNTSSADPTVNTTEQTFDEVPTVSEPIMPSEPKSNNLVDDTTLFDELNGQNSIYLSAAVPLLDDNGNFNPLAEQIQQEAINTHHNEQVELSNNPVPINLQAPSQKTPIADAISRSMWLDYMSDNNFQNNIELREKFADMVMGFDWAMLDVLTDKSYEQAMNGTLEGGREWRTDISDGDRSGVSAKLMNMAAGITQNFDKLMTTLNMPRIGYEADSTIPSKMLSQVKSKSQGTYSQIHKMFVKPMTRATNELAIKLRRSYSEIEKDIGQLATTNHILNEAAEAMWRGYERQITIRTEQLNAIKQQIIATPAHLPIRQTYMNKVDLLQNEIDRLNAELKTRQDMYEGRVAWDNETPMPGGYTKATAEKVINDLKTKYGADFAQVETQSKELVKTIRSIRNFATASGVFTNQDLKVFDDLGFTEYVPLYAEQQDPTKVDETNNYTQQSWMDKLLQDIPHNQAKSMGLTKDLSRFHREGAKSPAADAYTNMKVFSMNMAARIGQQGFLDVLQQMYEGTVGQPISATQITDETRLTELNATPDSGTIPGLIRVRTGAENYMVRDLKEKIPNIKPITAKGYDSHGNLVSFDYFFTEPTIQNEVYSSMDMQETMFTKHLRSLGSLTRFSSAMMTSAKPVWLAYNYVRDSFERISIMLMRPVKDKNGKLVNKWDLTKAYFKNLTQISASLKAQNEIYRYLTLGETKTKLQKILNEAVGSGAINLMTSQTEKHSIMGELNKSTVDKMRTKIAKALGSEMNKAGLGKAKHMSEEAFEFYMMRLVEVPQITTALASYIAYNDVGVNKMETSNRVRDQYDPTRVNNTTINSASQLFPFMRSTFTGHYNLARTLTEYWKPGERLWTSSYIAGGIAVTIMLIAAMSGMMGDDDDGTPKMARLPLSTLMGGIPVPYGENGVWTAPIGFGLNKLDWGIGAIMYKYFHGQITGSDATKAMMGLVVDNTSPIQMASGTIMSDNPVAGVILTGTPLLVKPFVESALNVRSFGGSKIITKDTPRDQFDSDQSNPKTPDGYKGFAKWLRQTGFGDFRPETLQYLSESYSYGPISAITKSAMQDRSEKTLGNQEKKGEIFGPYLTAIGADMSFQPNALDLANQTYVMQNLRYELHKKYGVGATHSDEDYEQYGVRGKRGGLKKNAKQVTHDMLVAKGVPQKEIEFIINSMDYDGERKTANKEFEDLAQKYYDERKKGNDDPAMRQAVQDAWDNLETLTHDYVKDNNRAYYDILQSK